MIKKRSVIIGFIGVAVVGVGVWAAKVVTRDDSALEPALITMGLRSILTAEVQPISDRYVRIFPGKVRATRRVELAFSVPGLLKELNAREGRNVRQGELLARLDRRYYRYALDVAQARCVHAKRELTRFSNLRDQKVTTEVKYEKAQTAYDIALAESHICEKALEDTVLLAPFDGVVVRRYVENHEHVLVKQAILSLQDISFIEVVIQVPENLIAQKGPDGLDKLQVNFDADRERWFDSSVKEYSLESDTVTKTYDVVLSLASPSDLKVYPGMTATVKAQLHNKSGSSEAGEHFTKIPVEALWGGNDGKSYVWVIDPGGGNPQKREVEARALSGDHVEIRSGLQPGEQVAIVGLHTLREDLQVRPRIAGKEGLDG